jgi:hypothetical protein
VEHPRFREAVEDIRESRGRKGWAGRLATKYQVSVQSAYSWRRKAIWLGLLDAKDCPIGQVSRVLTAREKNLLRVMVENDATVAEVARCFRWDRRWAEKEIAWMRNRLNGQKST